MTNKFCLIGFLIINTFLLPGFVFADGDYIILIDNDEAKSVISASEQSPVTVRALNPRSLTTCFELESSTGGTFYNSSHEVIGQKVKSNIPKNENGISNRNFYYSPSSATDTVFLLKTFLRPSEVTTSCDTWSPEGDIWQTYQKAVTVSSSGVDGGDSGSGADTSTASTTLVTDSVGTTNNSTGGSSSAHSSSAPLSSTGNPIKFEVSAGRERITAVDNSVAFDAVVTKGGDFFNPIFTWSFGDGTSYSSKSVYHSYALPGTYEVVLNAVSGNEKAVSRTRVIVTNPQVIIDSADFSAGYLILKNKSNKEVNLGDWKLSNDSKDFTFPTDTLIVPGGTLPIPFSVLDFLIGSSTQKLILKDAQNKELATVGNSLLTKNNNNSSDLGNNSLAEIESKLALVSDQVNILALNQMSTYQTEKVDISEGKSKVFNMSGAVTAKATTTSNYNQLANVGAIPIVIPKPTGWYDYVKNWPTLGIRLIRGILGK